MDYVPEDERSLTIDIAQDSTAEGIFPEISEDIANSTPTEVDQLNNSITAEIEREQLSQFKERDDHIESKERESEIDANMVDDEQPLT